MCHQIPHAFQHQLFQEQVPTLCHILSSFVTIKCLAVSKGTSHTFINPNIKMSFIWNHYSMKFNMIKQEFIKAIKEHPVALVYRVIGLTLLWGMVWPVINLQVMIGQAMGLGLKALLLQNLCDLHVNDYKNTFLPFYPTFLQVILGGSDSVNNPNHDYNRLQLLQEV
ncbi:hypothetical protein L218DRAFT_949306 [Marasmius fiardii PR-910]|nr:hypothetical protein L218DRAFT_949306 [Marasmius fiardii PR-910]